MPDLKSVRTSLQETMEDDATGKGSASRVVLILGSVALCSALFVAVVIHSTGLHDMADIAKHLIYAIGGGGSANYITKLFKGSANAVPTQPGTENPQGEGQ